MKLRGKVAIVTGSGQGIGRENILALAREGANVVVTDITDKIYDVAKETEFLGSRVLAIKADVSNSRDVKVVVAQTFDEFKRIDILVNNAGIYKRTPLIEMSEEQWDKILAVNLKGVFNCCKAVLPTMINQKYGKIINIASIFGYSVGYPNSTHYSASKYGIVGLTRSLAIEVAQHNINVNVVCPGVIETPFIMKYRGKKDLEKIAQAIPLKRVGQPIDVAKLVVFLSSDDSNFITGQSIVIDGGHSILLAAY